MNGILKDHTKPV